jgi:hypothetical protein
MGANFLTGTGVGATSVDTISQAEINTMRLNKLTTLTNFIISTS